MVLRSLLAIALLAQTKSSTPNLDRMAASGSTMLTTASYQMVDPAGAPQCQIDYQLYLSPKKYDDSQYVFTLPSGDSFVLRVESRHDPEHRKAVLRMPDRSTIVLEYEDPAHAQLRFEKRVLKVDARKPPEHELTRAEARDFRTGLPLGGYQLVELLKHTRGDSCESQLKLWCGATADVLLDLFLEDDEIGADAVNDKGWTLKALGEKTKVESPPQAN
jgi:hypothetical protein